jgi:2',3'-cyclic-nucleotide 2'-phosphodiesterase (5'-nucleotidase family)
VFDAGDAFNGGSLGGTPAPAAVAADKGEVERRARLLATALARAGITAFTPGERDLAVGPALFRRVMADAKIPVVSANLYDQQGARVFDPDRIVDAAGVKVGVFGVTRALPENAADWQGWGIAARDPVAAARDEVASLRGRGAAIVVALLHVGTMHDTHDLLTKVPGIDWAVLGHSGTMPETPEEIGGARAVEAMTQGKNLGRLDLHIVGDARRARLSFADVGQRAQVTAILADHQRQIADYRKRLADTPPPQPQVKQFFEGRVHDLEAAVARETALLATLPAKIEGDWFENRIFPLNATVPDQPGVAMLVAAYNRENARRAAAGLPVGIGTPSHGPPAAPAPPGPLAYVGTAACGGCHKEALAFWRTTKHARAMEALAKVKRDRDPTCVGCHVTGYLRPGGPNDVALAATRFREVGCEACHGPGLTHAGAPTAPAPAGVTAVLSRKVPAAVCLGCHTPDQTNGDFDYAAFLQAVVGPGHGGG